MMQTQTERWAKRMFPSDKPLPQKFVEAVDLAEDKINFVGGGALNGKDLVMIGLMTGTLKPTKRETVEAG